MQVVAQCACYRDGIGQVALDRRFLADPPEEAKEGATGIGGISAAPGVVDEVLDPGGDHRFEQILLGREMAVDGSGADAGAGGNFVERHAVPECGERFPRGAKDLLPVALRIRAQKPLSHGC